MPPLSRPISLIFPLILKTKTRVYIARMITITLVCIAIFLRRHAVSNFQVKHARRPDARVCIQVAFFYNTCTYHSCCNAITIASPTWSPYQPSYTHTALLSATIPHCIPGLCGSCIHYKYAPPMEISEGKIPRTRMKNPSTPRSQPHPDVLCIQISPCPPPPPDLSMSNLISRHKLRKKKTRLIPDHPESYFTKSVSNRHEVHENALKIVLFHFPFYDQTFHSLTFFHRLYSQNPHHSIQISISPWHDFESNEKIKK